MKPKLSIYLLFDGNCVSAMQFYKSVFPGVLTLTKVAESTIKDMMPPDSHHKVINARLINDQVDISASDWLHPVERPIHGNMVCLYLNGGSKEELTTLFDKLAVGANVTDPLAEMFFGLYGALQDAYGIRWMFQANNP